MNLLSRYYHTIKYLKSGQIWNRLVFPVKLRWANRRLVSWMSSNVQTEAVRLISSITTPESYNGKSTFSFLNRTHQFTRGTINWNFQEEGKLWQYHLRYFDYLNQAGVKKEVGLKHIHDFINSIENREISLEPYPTSLRCINWIKFISANSIQDEQIDRALYAQFLFLKNTLEYHLLANHLLENLLSLLWAACYFKEDKLYKLIEPELKEQLDKQILQDGAHYELSPMYHNILLFRILDCVNLLSNHHWNKSIEKLLIQKAEVMLRWSRFMRFENGRLPYFNDSVAGIAPEYTELKNYAERLGLSEENIEFTDSGYRTFEYGSSEFIVDVGNIGVDYQPAHAHCDMLSFEMHQNNKPVLVNTGISTYEVNQRRQYERSTEAHNTVKYYGLEQSDVWKAFRVGRRAQLNLIKDDQDHLIAQHNGFKKEGGAIHRREWRYDEKSKLIVVDEMISDEKNDFSIAWYHFHPDVEIEQVSNNNFNINHKTWRFQEFENIQVESYQWAAGFNSLIDSNRLKVVFQDKLITTIDL